EVLEPRDAAGGERGERPGADRVRPDLVLAEVARQVAGDRLQRGLRHAHPVVLGPRLGELSKSSVTSDPPCSRIKGRNPAASSLKENALTCRAVATLSHGVFRKLPPSASCG